MQLQADRAGRYLLAQRVRQTGVALAEEPQIHRKRIGCLQHPRQMPGSGRAGGGERAGRRTRAPAQHRCDAGHQRFLDLLRADEVDVRVDAARGDDHAFAGDNFGPGANGDRDRGLNIGITCLANCRYAAMLQTDVSLDDAPVIDDHGVGYHRIGDFGGNALALAHAVPDDLAAAELHFLSIDSGVAFDLHHKIGVSQPYPVPGCRSVHFRVRAARNRACHQSLPMILPLKP